MSMYDKDAEFWATLYSAFYNHGGAGVMAFILSYLRILYDHPEDKPTRQFIEAALGGCIAFVAGMTFQAFDLSYGWTYAVVGCIGVFGVTQVRILAQNWAQKKVE